MEEILGAILRKINKILQNQWPESIGLKGSGKPLLDLEFAIEDCLNLKETCAIILEFLMLDKEENIHSNTARLYSSVLKDWNDIYPTPTSKRIRINTTDPQDISDYSRLLDISYRWNAGYTWMDRSDPISIMTFQIYPAFLRLYSEEYKALKANISNANTHSISNLTKDIFFRNKNGVRV